MEKEVLVSASFYNKKYYINDMFDKLSMSIKQELKEICLKYVEQFKCIIIIGFYEDGEIYIETNVSEENEFNFMEIDAKLAIKKIEDNNKELFEGLRKYYIYLKGTDIYKKGKNNENR